MTELELSALERAIRLKVALLDRVRASPASDWPRHVRAFLSELAAIGLGDERARFVLLATAMEELRLAASHSEAAASSWTWSERFLDTCVRTGDLIDKCEEALRRLEQSVVQRQGTTEPASPCTSRIARLIDRRYMDKLTLATLAATVREPRSRLAVTFRQEMGTTIHDYLTRVRVEHAADRLQAGEKVEAVMLAVGYHSKRSFYRQFRSLTGVAPGAYRDATRATHTGHRGALDRRFDVPARGSAKGPLN